MKSVKTMKTEKIWSVLPVMYIPGILLVSVWPRLPQQGSGCDVPKAFMGSCFAGAIATSHAFFIFNVSISSGVGAFLAVLDDSARSFRVSEAV